jgi:hypothetical protein
MLMITDQVDHVVLEDPGQEEPDSPDVRLDGANL